MSRGTRRLLDAIIHIDRLLRVRDCPSLERLSVELEANTRTVQRYLRTMRERLHIEIDYDRERGGYAYRSDGLNLPPAHLSEGELVALTISRPLLNRYQGTPVEAWFRDVFEKIEARLPERVQREMSELSRRISSELPILRSESVALFEPLLEAVRKQRSLDIQYQGRKDRAARKRRIDPYGLREARGHWYVLAFCHDRQAVRIFEIGRIQELETLEQSFELAEDFDLESYFRGSMGLFRSSEARPTTRSHVAVFEAEAVPYVQDRVFHPTQVMESLDDGRLRLSVDLETSEDFVRLVLSYADLVEVIEPPDVRVLVAERFRRAAGRYDFYS